MSRNEFWAVGCPFGILKSEEIARNLIGYRMTTVRLENNRAVKYEVFAEGWLQGWKAWGRPVDVQVMPGVALLVSDDSAGAIYRISFKK